MKFLLTQSFFLVLSVSFLYYLFTNDTFLPVDSVGDYNWSNIVTVIFVLTIISFSLFSLISYGLLKLTRKNLDSNGIARQSFKYSCVLTLGLLLVLFLHLYGVIYWPIGLAIFAVVLILFFVIL